MIRSRWISLFVLATAPLAATTGCAVDAPGDGSEETSSEEALSTAPDAPTITPSDLAKRYLTCPVRNTEKAAEASFRGKRYVYKTDAEMNPRSADWESRATMDDHALDGLVPADANALLIDIRRVGGKPAYAYYGAHGRAHSTYEPWSSAKFEAASAAMAKVRVGSNHAVGGDATVGRHKVGDMVTAMTAYRPSGNVSASSNSLAGYFLTVAGASHTSGLFGSSWLNLANDASRFHVSSNTARTSSAWGEAPFYPGSRVWKDASAKAFTTSPDTRMADTKPMSAMAQGEWLKRLSQHELAPESSLPDIQPADLDVLFYGAPRSSQPGGMLAGVSNYVANAIAGTSAADSATTTRTKLEQRVGNNWRIFHKVGWGDSPSRSRSEVVLASYACLPDLDGGHEFVLVLRTSVPLSSVENAGAVAQKRADSIIDAALAAK